MEVSRKTPLRRKRASPAAWPAFKFGGRRAFEEEPEGLECRRGGRPSLLRGTAAENRDYLGL
jgi:hypothetical protein